MEFEPDEYFGWLSSLEPEERRKHMTEILSGIKNAQEIVENSEKLMSIIRQDEKLIEAYRKAKKRGFLTLPEGSADERMEDMFSESKKGKLYFEDKSGERHRAYRPNEKISEDIEAPEGINENSFNKILYAKAMGDFSRLNAAERKEAEGTGAGGDFLVSLEVFTPFFDMVRNKATFLGAGAITILMNSPEMRLVRILSDPTAYWRKENSAITESKGTIAPVTLRVSTLAGLVVHPLEHIQDASNASDLIQTSMVGSLGVEMDRVAYYGNGQKEPRGLLNTSGVNEISMGTNGAALSNYDPFSEACQKIEEANGEPKAVVMAPRTYYALDRLKDGNNQPLQPPKSFQDLRKFRTNQIPTDDTQGSATNASHAFVGDFSQMVLGIHRGGIRVDISRDAGDAFKKMQIYFRIYVRMDIAILRPDHFTKIVGIIPA